MEIETIKKPSTPSQKKRIRLRSMCFELVNVAHTANIQTCSMFTYFIIHLFLEILTQFGNKKYPIEDMSD